MTAPSQPIEKIRTGEKFAYGCGDLASNLVLVLTSTYITFFYTDALGLNVGIIGSIVLLSRVFDGFTDILMGFIMDKTRSRHGKARAWMLWLAVPFGIATALMMCVPAGWSDTAKYIYVFISYNVTTTFLYTAINIPYGSLNSLMSRDQHERESINVWRMTMAQLGGLVINACTLPLINAIGGSSNQKAWIIVSCIYGLMATLLFLFCFAKTKERVHAVSDADQRIGFGKTMQILLKNNNWLLICLIWVIMSLGLGLGMSVGTYYCKYQLGNENLYGFMSVVQTGVMLVFMLPMPFLIKKFGKRNVALVGSALYTAAQALVLVAPLSVPWLMFCAALKGATMSTLTATIFAMVADTIEYGQWKTGVRVEGTLYSATTFGAKIGAGVGMALASSILGAAGYDGLAAVQGEAAMDAIARLFLVAPILITVFIPIVLYFYKLDTIYPQVMKDLAAREQERH